MVKMRAFGLSIIASLVLSAAEISAMPVSSSSLVTRSQCANAPFTVAGTPLGRRDIISARSLAPSHARAITTTTWCAPNSQTYVIITVTRQIATPVILQLLDDAYSSVLSHIAIHGDGLIVDGQFNWAGAAGLVLRTANANNHQQTWGVLGAALDALGAFTQQNQMVAGAAIFSIFDGMNMVGLGSIQ